MLLNVAISLNSSISTNFSTNISTFILAILEWIHFDLVKNVHIFKTYSIKLVVMQPNSARLGSAWIQLELVAFHLGSAWLVLSYGPAQIAKL